jgi:hypothetical protein
VERNPILLMPAQRFGERQGDQRQEHLRNAVVSVAPAITNLLGKEVSEVQHLKKFMEQVNPTEVRETRMNIGDSYVPWRSTHCKPHYTKSAARLTIPKQPSHQLQKGLSTRFNRQNAPDLGHKALPLLVSHSGPPVGLLLKVSRPSRKGPTWKQSDTTLPRFFRMDSRPYSLLYLLCFYFLLAANAAFFGSFEVLPKFFAIRFLRFLISYKWKVRSFDAKSRPGDEWRTWNRHSTGRAR